MKKLMSVVRRCIDDYGMIDEGDSVAVGLSGGKDSLTLLNALAGLRAFYPRAFALRAVTVDPGLGADYSRVADLCAALDVEYTVHPTKLARVIFEERKESSPCSMCSKMRRGALNDLARKLGCNKVALGHHFDDAVETFMLSLLYEGRISCFEPVTYMSRADITQIRPLLYMNEKAISDFAARYDLPIVKNPCPANGYTKRQEVKDLLSELMLRYPYLKGRIFSSMQRLPLSGWAPLRPGRASKRGYMYDGASHTEQPPQYQQQCKSGHAQYRDDDGIEPVDAEREACEIAEQIEQIEGGKTKKRIETEF